VVVLHDAYLSNVWNLHLAAAGNEEAFQRLLLRNHGWAAVAADARSGREATLKRFPCSLEVVQDSCGLILHSRHARDVLATHFGAPALASAAIIPHLRRPPALPDRATARRRLGVADDVFLVCSFGAVAPTKVPELVLAGWRAAGLGDRARLVFVGEAGADQEALFTAGMAARGASVSGRVDDATYRAWLAAADAAIQLRASSRGESSGAIADCLGASLPLIANAHGSAAELPPDTCLMLADTPAPGEIADALRHLAGAPALRTGLAAAARAHATGTLAPHRVAERYAEAIEAAWARHGLHGAVRGIRAAPSCTGSDPIALATALAATFPRPGPGHIFVDAAAMVQAGGGDVLANWLAGHPPHLRVQPVTLEQGRLRVASALAGRLLALAVAPGLDDWAEPRPGDVLLCGPAMADDGMTRRLALSGVTVHRVDWALARGLAAAELASLMTQGDAP
jgi:glycosyltransferase involved in cell wall biosynthesis